MTPLVQVGLMKAHALELARMTEGAPGDMLALLSKKSADWQQLAEAREQLLLAPVVKPDTSGKDTEALRADFAEVGHTWRISEPAGIYSWRFFDLLLGIPKNFATSLQAAKMVELVFEDAPGGDSGVADRMLAMLQAAGVFVSGRVTKCACSSHAALFVLGCGRRVMHRDAKLMLHSPKMTDHGTAAQKLKVVRLLQKLEERCIVQHVERTGQPRSVVAGWFDGRNHWFDAATAKAFGMCDEIFGDGCLIGSVASEGLPPSGAAVGERVLTGKS